MPGKYTSNEPLRAGKATLYEGGIRSAAFAVWPGNIAAGESVSDPAKYYRNNVTHTQNLLDAMVEHAVRYLVFSSTAAIFGDPHLRGFCACCAEPVFCASFFALTL